MKSAPVKAGRTKDAKTPRQRMKHATIIAQTSSVSAAEIKKYSRGSVEFNTNHLKNKTLRTKLEYTKNAMQEAAASAAAAEVLLPATAGAIQLEDDNMKVYKLKQRDIIENIDLNTARHAFDLQLHNFGPYTVNYTRNGRYLLFGGRKGHVATYDCHTMTVGTELQLEQDVYDVQYLHNETMFAVAQRRYLYIYDQSGVEIHCLKRHERPLALDYLPYHFLLVSAGHSGWVKWHDISIGEYICGFQTGHGPFRVLKQNPINAVVHCGHSNGVVSLWCPSAGKPLASMLCHKAPVLDLAVDREGRYMTTVSIDGYLKIWDIRKFASLHAFRLNKPANTVDISERGMIGVGMGRNIQLLHGAFTSPTNVTYLNHEIRTPNSSLSSGGGATAAAKALLSKVSIQSIKFRPLEDILCAGHSHGITSIVVPGSGEPNFDSFEQNPFMTTKQRREAEVQQLLNKLSPDMIGLDTGFIGSLEKNSKELKIEHEEIFNNSPSTSAGEKNKDKNRKRGRNKISARLRRKQKNVVDEQYVKLQEKKKLFKESARPSIKSDSADKLGALSRFAK